MGTNYYLHIGKRSSQGNDRPRLFSWAVGRRSGWLEHFGETRVIDEYGKEMSWSDFYQMIQSDQSDESAIGKDFS